MEKNYLKVYIKGEDEKTVYIRLHQNFVDLNAEVIPYIPNSNKFSFRMYWIDEDGDSIDIVDNSSYEIFLDQSKTKKIVIDTRNKKQTPVPKHETCFSAHVQSNEKKPLNVNTVHIGIECDGCGEYPITGFRYKCVQCPNFDLCLKCEGQMMHKQHNMLRLSIPIDKFHHIHRFLKKARKSCSVHPEIELEHGPHVPGGFRYRREGSNTSTTKKNIFSNLYTMMNDLAEGTDIPVSISPQESVGCKNEKVEKPAENKQKQERDQEKKEIEIDPNFAKIGIQILNNFGEMFTKMLDPLGINVAVDIDVKDDKEKFEKGLQNKTLNEEENKKSPEPEKKPENDSKTNEKLSREAPDNENLTTEETKNNQENKTNSIGDVSSDWTLVYRNTEDKRASINDDEGAVGADKNAPESYNSKEDEKIPSAIYTKLNQSVKQQFKNENKLETRAQIVYHSKPHINNAVIAMTAMGFSNEGHWLTQLLESVDGDISQALDLMKPVK